MATISSKLQLSTKLSFSYDIVNKTLDVSSFTRKMQLSSAIIFFTVIKVLLSYVVVWISFGLHCSNILLVFTGQPAPQSLFVI